MMRLEGQGAQGPGRQSQPGGQEGGHPQVGHHPQGIPRTASRSWVILVDRFSISMHAVQACRSRQERAESGVRTGRTATV
ncbi:hypothetical protein QRX41_07580 [Bifidobacterium sp. H1HS16N]|uniref:Uncharacterized protein n=2 Tax=Bifidobacterium TaxID=1678 RepID=A0ABU3KGY8_9BIFI|nr:hypothetical protein [Bifidobacterium sp. H1HS16N]MDT7509983.1 hypothetical protein [Bifidobacterium sp. H1HS16N]